MRHTLYCAAPNKTPRADGGTLLAKVLVQTPKRTEMH
jgi:hypothetical protein